VEPEAGDGRHISSHAAFAGLEVDNVPFGRTRPCYKAAIRDAVPEMQAIGEWDIACFGNYFNQEV
jgi:hypothetical protein